MRNAEYRRRPVRDRLHHPDRDHDQREDEDLAAVALAHPVVDGRRREQRHRELGEGPDEAGTDAAGDPPALWSHRRVHETPTGAASVAL